MPPYLVWWNLLSSGLSLGIALGIGLTAVLLKNKNGADSSIAIPARFRLLAVLGTTSLAIYGLYFLLLFPLHRYYNLKQVSLGGVAERHAGVALGTTAATLALFLLYYLAYRLCRGQNDRRLWVILLLGVLLFALVTFFVCIITTLDPYDYIARGRITGVHGGNPYVQVPNDYPADPFMEHIAWRNATSAYGPLWEVLSGLISRCAGDRLWPNVLAYKGLALVSYLLSTLMIAATLRRVAPDHALSGTLLFAWNPLVLLEGLANAHNDLLMVALLLSAFWVLSQTHQTSTEESTSNKRTWGLVYGGLALVLLGMAVLVKFVPILLFPPFLLYLLVRERCWQRQLGLGLLLLIPVALVFVQCYYIFWQWPDVANTLVRRVDMFRMSIASVTKEALQQHIDNEVAQALASWPFLVAFVLSYLIVLGRTTYALRKTPPPEGEGESLASRRGFLRAVGRFLLGRWEIGQKRPWDILVGACFSIFLLYLLLANFWFWPWYLTWPIALLALSGDERTVVPLTLAGCAGEVSHVGWNFVWYWLGISWDTLYQVDALVVFFMVVPALLAYAIPKHRELRSNEQ